MATTDHDCPECGSDDTDLDDVGAYEEFGVIWVCQACGCAWYDYPTETAPNIAIHGRTHT